MEASTVLHQVTNTHTLGQSLASCPKQQQQQILLPPPEEEQQERRMRPPPPERALICPRCESTNTKFCYYNNYSLSQPRYFCKGCRRYWTQGGTLRNVPVGGGCRKNKRVSSKKSPNPFLPSLPSPPLPVFSPFSSIKNRSFPDRDGGWLLGGAAGSLAPLPGVSPLLLDILRSGSPEDSHRSFYGGPAGLRFGEIGAEDEHWKAGGECFLGGLQQQQQQPEEEEEERRDLWSSARSNWHGLINSTLM